MNRPIKRQWFFAGVLFAGNLLISQASQAMESTLFSESSNGVVNLTFPAENKETEIAVSSARSEAYGWLPGQKIRLSAYVQHSDGSKEFLRDAGGSQAWEMTLDEKGEGSLRLPADERFFSGRLVLQAEGKDFYEPPTGADRPEGRWMEKVYEYRFQDGVRIKVHYTDQSLEASHAPSDMASQVLDAAVMAYQTITDFEGFNTRGYSFASPDKSYAYDPDKTIDIYIGDPNGENGYEGLGERNRMFRDAPCFDTIQLSDTEYQAVILLPANYREFIKNWEKINPSSLGTRNIHVDLRGTLIHEMLHTIVFYYNKNLNKSSHGHGGEGMEAGSSEGKDLDWYVEGLARYFETFAGARHDFYSQGFKQTFADKIRFSRGGSNYFMRYPDQPFTGLRYENALFWRFMDYRYGMNAIERISRDFRNDNMNFKEALEKVSGRPFDELLKQFALSVLLKDFGLKEDSGYLNDIAKTQLRVKRGAFYLLDGRGGEKPLGNKCATDWVGSWENARASFGEPSVAGDSTEDADVSGWATDFYQIQLDAASPELPLIQFTHRGTGAPLYVQAVCFSKGGTRMQAALPALAKQRSASLDLKALVAKNSLDASDIDKIYLLVTNSDAHLDARYEMEIE